MKLIKTLEEFKEDLLTEGVKPTIDPLPPLDIKLYEYANSHQDL